MKSPLPSGQSAAAGSSSAGGAPAAGEASPVGAEAAGGNSPGGAAASAEAAGGEAWLELVSEVGPGRISMERLEGWARLYGVRPRQLRRWIARGVEKGEPCPLDEPVKMPAWVDKHVEKVRRGMRDCVQAAAEAARAAAPAAPVVESAAASSAAEAAAEPPAGKSIDLAAVGGVEGQSVELFRRLFAAVKTEIEDAYKKGDDVLITKLHRRIAEVGESLRKHEVAAEAKAKRSGLLLDRAVVLNDVATALNTMKLLHEQMPKLVLAELAGLDQATADQVRAAIERARERELTALRNLKSCKKPEDVFELLAA